MKAEIINPFLLATREILGMEAGIEGIWGEISLASSKWTTQEVTVIINIIGQINGTFLIGMSITTAEKLVSIIMGQEMASFDSMVISGVAEMANIISGRALIQLEQIGYLSDITPPMILFGARASISTLKRRRIQIPLDTEIGLVELSVAFEGD
jgi:chemotaxis protein CheX